MFRDARAECRLHGQRDRVHVGPANGHHIRSARHRHRRENGAGERPLFFAGLRDGQLYWRQLRVVLTPETGGGSAASGNEDLMQVIKNGKFSFQNQLPGR